MTIYSLDVLLFLFGTSLLFHVVNMELFMFKPVVNDFIEKYLVALIFHLILWWISSVLITTYSYLCRINSLWFEIAGFQALSSRLVCPVVMLTGGKVLRFSSWPQCSGPEATAVPLPCLWPSGASAWLPAPALCLLCVPCHWTRRNPASSPCAVAARVYSVLCENGQVSWMALCVAHVIYLLICFKNSFTHMFILCARHWTHSIYDTDVSCVLMMIIFKSVRQI